MRALDKLMTRVRRLHNATPALRDYAPWPTDLQPATTAAKTYPIAHKIAQLPARKTRATAPIIAALQEAAPHLRWKRTYSESEVGHHFLQNYGYVELFGPDGHFQSVQVRGYIGIWGPGLTYDWHTHEAEELYFGLAGEAVFCADGAQNVILKPGKSRTHHSNQRHLMVTLDRAFVAYALWRGAGMDGLPHIVAA